MGVRRTQASSVLLFAYGVQLLGIQVNDRLGFQPMGLAAFSDTQKPTSTRFPSAVLIELPLPKTKSMGSNGFGRSKGMSLCCWRVLNCRVYSQAVSTNIDNPVLRDLCRRARTS